jgi:SAM-dependent methyltransferase
LNIGAGAGSYEPLDRYVLPIEPSAMMRAQRPLRLSPAVRGFAEDLPVDDQAFDASMATITVHQWSSLERGIEEMRRVTRGPIVILTFDGPALREFWLGDYAPEMLDVECRRYPDIGRLCKLLGGQRSVKTVLIPHDCTDGFASAYYGRPEWFLDPSVRRSQSAWTFVGPEVQEWSMERLREDLTSGGWDARYGHLRTQAEFDGALRLLVSRDRR